VFRDLGFDKDEAENLKLRAELMMRIEDFYRKSGLTQIEAARALGLTQPRLSALLKGRIGLFSIDAGQRRRERRNARRDESEESRAQRGRYTALLSSGVIAESRAMNRVKEVRRQTILVWREFATAERRTAWSLLRLGFLHWREPSLIREGQKPDFLAFGRGRMWVEVKSFEPPASQALLGTAWNELKPRLAAIAGPCRVDAQVSGAYDQRAVTIAVRILERQLAQVSDGEVFYVGIPRDPVKRSLVTLEYAASSGSVRMFSPRSVSGMYGYPRWAAPANWSAELTIRDWQSVAQERAYKVLHAMEPCAVMLRVERQSPHRGLSSMSGAEADNVKTVDKLRERIEDAARQLRNGQRFLGAPGVVTVYNDHLGADHSELFRACLGDITIAINHPSLESDPPFLGKNGVMRPDKNTTVSAVTYASRHFPPVSLLNPYAALPVRAAWLAGTVYHVAQNGDVVVVRA
jgi:predicted XRE-type DNA-binding protein